MTGPAARFLACDGQFGGKGQRRIRTGKRPCGYLEGWPPGFPAKRNHVCSRLVLRLTPRNGSVRCGTVCSKIVYSVRIGPPPREVFFSTGSRYPATIPIDKEVRGDRLDEVK